MLEKPNFDLLLNHGTHLARGSVQGFIGSAVSLPTGLITAACLTRWLGPDSYGLLTVAATIVSLIELSITTGFCRSAEKLIPETENWRPVATKFVQTQFAVSIAVAFLLVATAPLIGSLLDSPPLSFFLRICAIGIPITALGNIHQSILIGRGHFGQRAVLQGAYWVIRMAVMLLFVYRYPTVTAAISANIAALALTLVWARVLVHPPILGQSDFPAERLWNYAWPLFFFTVGLSLFRQIDLLFVKSLCRAPEMAGFYGATKNLTIIPVLVAASLSPVLLSKLSKLIQLGQHEPAQIMAKTAIRLIFCLFPFAGLAAGAAPEIVSAVYGAAFLEAAPLLAILIFGALGFTLISVTVSILVATGRPRLPFQLTGPLLPAAIAAHTVFIPQSGAIGATIVTTGLAWTGALLMTTAIYRVWGIKPSMLTLLRSALITVLAYGVAIAWPTPGIQIFLKLPILCFFILIAFILAGEFSFRETAMAIKIFMAPGQRDQNHNAMNGNKNT